MKCKIELQNNQSYELQEKCLHRTSFKLFITGGALENLI